MKVLMFLALLSVVGCEESKVDNGLEKRIESSSGSSVDDHILDTEDCDEKAAKLENKAEETMINLQGDADAGCAIE